MIMNSLSGVGASVDRMTLPNLCTISYKHRPERTNKTEIFNEFIRGTIISIIFFINKFGNGNL